MASERLKPDPTRVAQLERDLTRAVNGLLVQFRQETGTSPFAVDLELTQEGQGPENQMLWVATHSRVHFDDADR